MLLSDTRCYQEEEKEEEKQHQQQQWWQGQKHREGMINFLMPSESSMQLPQQKGLTHQVMEGKTNSNQ